MKPTVTIAWNEHDGSYDIGYAGLEDMSEVIELIECFLESFAEGLEDKDDDEVIH